MRLFCSPSQSALDAAIDERISNALNTGAHTFVIVPAQLGFNTERRIIHQCSADGFYSIEVVSFEKLARLILERAAGRAIPTIDNTGLTMLAKEALISLECELEVLDARHDDSLHKRLAALVKALRSEGITPEALTKAEGSPGVLKGKLTDVAKLYSRIENAPDGMDEAALEQFAYSRAADADFLKGCDIIVHSFDALSRLRIDALKALDTTANVSVYLLAQPDNELFFSTNRLASELSGDITKLPDSRTDETAMLSRELFCYPYKKLPAPAQSIRIYKCADERTEVKAAAALAISQISSGISPSDIAVCVSDMSAYSALLSEVFTASKLPFFIEDKRSLYGSDISVLVLSALKIISEGWRLRDILRHIKTGLLPVSAADADELIRYIKEHGIKGYMLRRELKEEAVETLRTRALSPLEELSQSEGSLPRRLIEYLEALSAEQKLEQLAGELSGAGMEQEAAYLRQTYERTISLLEQADRYLPDADARALYSALSAGFESSAIAVTPPLEGQITVGELTHSIFPRVRRMIVIGVCDSLVPHIDDGAGIITSGEAEALSGVLPYFPTSLSPDEQKALIMRVFAAGDELALIYNSRAGASYIIDRVKRLAGIFETPPPELLSRSEALIQAASELRSLADGADFAAENLALFLASEPQSVGQLAAYMQPRPTRLRPDTSRKIYGGLRGSASVIEDFYRCSYKHFLDYGIRPVELRELREDALSVGNYIHSLLESVTHGLASKNMSLSDAGDEHIRGIIDAAADEMRSTHNKGIFKNKRYAITEKRLREEVLLATRAIRASLSGMEIAGSEFSFRRDLNGITLTGRIDRIDKSENGFLRVVDYKSGRKGFDLSELYYGLSIQLMVYLIAAIELMPDSEPAGGFYMNVSLPYIASDETEEDRMKELRMNGFALADADAARCMETAEGKLHTIKLSLDKNGVPSGSNAFSRDELSRLMQHCERLAENAVRCIFSGELSATPAHIGASLPCDYCEYASVCRREDAERSLAKLSKEEIFNELDTADE